MKIGRSVNGEAAPSTGTDSTERSMLLTICRGRVIISSKLSRKPRSLTRPGDDERASTCYLFRVRLSVTYRQKGCEVLLIAAQWQPRALLLAELQEAGYEVAALPGLRVALPALVAGRVRPALVVLDVVGDPEAHPQRVQQMLRLLEVPVVLLVGAYRATSFSPLQGQVSAWLTRPLRVGSVVAAVRRLCPPEALGPRQIRDK